MSSTRLMACQGEGSMILSCVQFNYESNLLGAFKLFFMRKKYKKNEKWQNQDRNMFRHQW